MASGWIATPRSGGTEGSIKRLLVINARNAEGPENLFARGLATRRKALGDTYVAAALYGADAFSLPLPEYCRGCVEQTWA